MCELNSTEAAGDGSGTSAVVNDARKWMCIADACYSLRFDCVLDCVVEIVCRPTAEALPADLVVDMLGEFTSSWQLGLENSGPPGAPERCDIRAILAARTGAALHSS